MSLKQGDFTQQSLFNLVNITKLKGITKVDSAQSLMRKRYFEKYSLQLIL